MGVPRCESERGKPFYAVSFWPSQPPRLACAGIKLLIMCYHTSQHQPLSIIKKTFNLTVKNEELFQQAFQLNGFTKPYLPVISSSDSKAIDMYRWGLIPFWVKDESNNPECQV